MRSSAPNGCGKSNVIDAIRWTLGEQSPGTLRGKAMADVIFSGAQGRPAANFAEVTLIFDNADGSFGGRYRRYAEIAVTRRLDRAGTSTYSINRQRCRLKDVVGLFVDTGVGARAYSIIEQGRVGFVVSARPEERKLLIDEVAGVNRFKGQRGEAERRMKETRTNLVRVGDLTGELERQRDGLAAQARKAERFMELRAQWKEMAVRALLVEVAQMTARRRVLGEESDEAQAAEDRCREAVSDAEQAATAAQEAAEQARQALAEHTTRRAELEAMVRAAEASERERAEEVVGLVERTARLESELRDLTRSERGAHTRRDEAAAAAAEARERFAEAKARQDEVLGAATKAADVARAARIALEEGKQRQLESMTAAARQRNSLTLLRRRLQDIGDELAGEEESRAQDAEREAQLADRVSSAESALNEAEAKRRAAREDKKAAGSALSEHEAKAKAARADGAIAEREASGVHALLAAESQLVATLAGAQPGIRALVDWLRGSGASSAAGEGFVGVVADLLSVPAGLEQATELALGDRVDGAVFSTPAALKAASRWVAEHRPGRAVLILLGEDVRKDGLGGRVTSEGLGLAGQLLGDIEVVASIEDATLRTGTSAVVLPDGIVHGLVVRLGASGGGSPLQRRARVRELEGQAKKAEAEAAVASTAAATAGAAVTTARDRLSDATQRMHAAELAELGCRRDLDAARRNRRSMSEEAARAVARRGRLEETRKRLAGELERVLVDSASTEETQRAIEAELDLLRGALLAAEESSSGTSARATTAQLDLSEARHEAAMLEREHRRANEEVGQREQRRARLEQEIRSAQSRASLLSDRAATAHEAALGVREELGGLAAAAQEVEGAAEAAREHELLTRARHTNRRQALEKARTKATKASNELARLDARLELAVRRGEQEFGLEAVELAVSILDEGAATTQVTTGPSRPALVVEVTREALELDPKQLAKRAARVARDADALGAVNMAAAEEFAEVDERWRQLIRQREDLEAALTDIRRAIRTIEDETRQRFKAAFEAVARKFASLYPRLVGGGKAELILTAPEDLLGTGVEIRVEPPGKRLQNLQLLSGGEKAMAAIAFVFAIFEVKPSPFCLLDEVDAPLDESNSRRFNSMLSELATTTQFMVITHNRTTMEVADVLYGVTMQAPGVSSVVSVRVDAPERAGRMRGPAGEEHP